MRATAFRSFAKVNLHLQVVGRRGDGYHELRTVFQTIDLHDRITVELGGAGVELEVDDQRLSAGPENLACRAAVRFLEAFGGASGARLRLRKRIPVGGGLGGGSSNAATVLLAMRRLCGGPERLLDLWPVARELGADVPYFLFGGTALGVGRGDEVLPLPEIPEGDLWLVLPPFEVSTRLVFAELGEIAAAPLAPAVLALAQGEVPARAALLGGWNDLEAAALRCAPALRDLYDTLQASGLEWLRMSGSGATFLAEIDPQEVENVTSRLPVGTRLKRVRTMSRQTLWARREIAAGESGDGDH